MQSKYFFGVTTGEPVIEIATAKQLWKLQDLSNKLYHFYYAIETVLDVCENKEIMNTLYDTKRMIDELSEISLPMSKSNTDKKIKLLIDALESTLPKFSKLVQDYKFNKSA